MDELVERLTEIANRDEAKTVTVRADDLRAVLAALAPVEAVPVADVERAVDAVGGSATAYSREQLAKLAYVAFYSPVLCAPQNIAAFVEEIDCCPGCDHVSNGGTCSRSERGDYCPNDLAETLRQISAALYGPRDPAHYVAGVFGPDKMTALAHPPAQAGAVTEARPTHRHKQRGSTVIPAEIAGVVEEWRTAMEVVTPKWHASDPGWYDHPDWAEIDGEGWLGFAKVATIVDGKPNAEGAANFNWLLRCSPDAIASLLTLIERLAAAQAETRRLALEEAATLAAAFADSEEVEAIAGLSESKGVGSPGWRKDAMHSHAQEVSERIASAIRALIDQPSTEGGKDG